MTRQPIKRHGGKSYLASWIVSHFPQRCQNPNAPAADDPGYLHYVEPYFGGGAVLFANDPEGISEVVNDLDGDLINFWQVLADESDFQEFVRIIEATPFCDCEWARAAFEWWNVESRADRAARFFIRCRQSRQALGKDFATLSRNRTRRGMNEQVAAWLSAIEGLPEAHERLKRVVILNDDATKVIRQQDGPRTLFYCDPPYMHETRNGTTEYGEHEMTYEQHEDLLQCLSQIQGRFVLSGYSCDLYHKVAYEESWRYEEKQIDNKASSAKTKEQKTECLWMNY